LRFWPTIRLAGAARHAAAGLVLMIPALSTAQALQPSEALDRYLARGDDEQPKCSDSLFAVQIDASLPALKKHGSMTGFKRIVHPGHVVYRDVRFTGDDLVKTHVITRFLSRDTSTPNSREIGVTRLNYVFEFEKASDYNGLGAYVFLLKPRRKRAGLFGGELWLNAETAAPLRLWGDLVKSPSIFVRSFRFVQDYQTAGPCTEPLRLLLTLRTRIAGTVEMTVLLHQVPEEPDTASAMDALPDFSMEVNRHK